VLIKNSLLREPITESLVFEAFSEASFVKSDLNFKEESNENVNIIFDALKTIHATYMLMIVFDVCNIRSFTDTISLVYARTFVHELTKEDILNEVRWLVSEGVREFNVIAQDLSSYGLDLYGEHRLAQLIDEMAQIEGVEWIRLHYAYPTDFPYDILPVMAKHPNVCKYIDIALQHCSSNVLEKMRRHITCEEQNALINRIREEVPGICIRTTLLVGHPGETEDDFNELCEWVKQMRFDRMGAFAYSEEEGTFAARHYNDDIPQEEKERRVDTLMALQQSISSEILSQMVGTKQRIVIDREEQEYYVGRTQYDSPEVDCEVLIDKAEKLQIGEFYVVNIIKSEDFDLYANL
jgi:ribosomal protein S12 methylthiotransferase